MRKKRLLQSIIAVVLSLAMIVTGVNIPGLGNVQAKAVDGSTIFGTPVNTLISGSDSKRYVLESTTYTLTADTEISGYLEIRDGITATIELNGHTLKRTDVSVTSPKVIGGVIVINGGTLIIQGDNGTITGGNSKNDNNSKNGQGGCIYFYNATMGTLKMYNTTIADCHTNSTGGAISGVSGKGFDAYLENCTITNCTSGFGSGAINIGNDQQKVTLNNCTITENHLTSKYGGGAIDNCGKLYLQGKCVIENNKTTCTTDNITYKDDILMGNSKGTIDASALSAGSHIGLVFSSGEKINSLEDGKVVDNLGTDKATVASYFFSNDPARGKKIEGNTLKLVGHDHNWSYSATDNVITATCPENPVGVACGVGTQTFTLDASKCSKIYDGNPITGATATPSAGWTTANGLTVPDIYYKGINGTSYESTTSVPTDAGTYQASITVGDATATDEFEITQADAAEPSARTGLNYNGTEQNLVTASPSAGSTIYYRVDGTGTWSTTIPTRKDVKRTDAGAVAAYKVEYYVDGGTNYKSVGSSDAPAGSFDVTITPKTLSTAMVTLALTEPVYDGSAKTQVVTISDSVSGTELISADDYTISENLTQTEVGEYTVVVKGQKNYTGEVTPTWKIKGRDFETNDYVAAPYDAAYDGRAHGITVTAAEHKSFEDFKVLYSDSENGTYSEDSTANKKKDAGTYEVWYKVTAKGHNATAPAKLTIKINKADAVVTPAANQSKKFGDSDPAYTFTATGLAEGETEATLGLTLKRTAGEAVGTYDYAIDSCTTTNYNVTLSTDAPKFQITGKPLEDPEITAAFKNSDIYVYDGNERDVTDDVVIKNGENVLIKGTDYELSGDVKKTSFGTYELIFEGKGNYTGKKKLSWKITDPNPPSGEIAFDETTKWDAFLNTITFDLFKGKDQKITITAADGEGESGVDKIYYHVSEKTEAMTKEEVEALPDSEWKEIVNGGSFTLTDSKKYIVYAKITDKSGNVTVISSDGFVIDQDAPVIAGVENDGKYCELRTIRVTDENLALVSVDGEAVTLKEDGTYQLSHKETEQTITAMDKVGNTTTMKVLVHAGHTWGEWVIDRAASETKTGKRHRECSVCHKQESESIPMKGEVRYQVSGTVMNESDHSKSVGNALVLLMDEAETKIIASTRTNENGAYHFDSVANGSYKVVVKNLYQKLAEENARVADANDIVSVIYADPLAGYADAQYTNVDPTKVPAEISITAESLNELLTAEEATDDQKGITAEDMAIVVSGGGLRIDVQNKPVDETTDVIEDKGKIQTEVAKTIANAEINYLDLSVLKTLLPLNADPKKPVRLIELASPIAVSLEIKDAKFQKSNLQIFRRHEKEAEAVEIKQGAEKANADGEYFEFDGDHEHIVLHVKKFSTYAMAVPKTGGSRGGSGSGSSTGAGGPTSGAEAGSGADAPKITPEVTEVIFNKPGETLTDKAEVTGLTDKKVTYTSADPKVATVDKDGKITAVAPGTTTITVTGSDNKTKAVIRVTVKAEEKKTEEEKQEEAKDDDNTSAIDNKHISSVKKSDFGKLRAKIIKTTKHSIKLQWTKQKDADGYIIYGNYCNHAGETYQLKKIMTVKGANKKSITFKDLEQATYYKYVVHAYKKVGGKKLILAKSVVVHGTTTGGEYGLAKAVKINQIGTKSYKTTKAVKYTMKKGKRVTLQAEEVYADLRAAEHRKLTLETSNAKIVKVTKTGKLKAVGKGTAKVWVYAQNGVYNTITITVK